MSTRTLVLALGFALGFAACDTGTKSDDGEEAKKDDGKKKKADEKPAATATAAPTGAQPAANPGATGTPAVPGANGQVGAVTAPVGSGTTPVTSPELQTYPDIANKISDGCAKAYAIAASAPNSVGDSYGWSWTRQAMLANQQFKVVSGDPTGLGEVTFDLHLASDKWQNAWVLVARCNNGLTCNKLASMLKAVVPNATPQVACDKLPMDLSAATFKKPVLRELGSPTSSLPDDKDGAGLCARLHACTVAMDTSKSGTEKLGLDCQKAPTKFKTSCAQKYPCQEVVKCMEGG
jgi:hypothetical protein